MDRSDSGANLIRCSEGVSGERAGSRPGLSIIEIWKSGRGDLFERHDKIIRECMKRSA
jgi:hypothetical protein